MIYDIWMGTYLLVACIGLIELLLDRKIIELSIKVSKKWKERGFKYDFSPPRPCENIIIGYDFPRTISPNHIPDYNKFSYFALQNDEANLLGKSIFTLL